MVYRVIIAIGKHIVADDALSGRGVAVRVDESAPAGVVIPALQVVEACFAVVDIATSSKLVTQTFYFIIAWEQNNRNKYTYFRSNSFPIYNRNFSMV